MPGDDQRPWPTNTIQGLPAWMGGEDGLAKSFQEALRDQFFRMYRHIPADERENLLREREELEAQKYLFQKGAGTPLERPDPELKRNLDASYDRAMAEQNRLREFIANPERLNATDRAVYEGMRRQGLEEIDRKIAEIRAKAAVPGSPESNESWWGPRLFDLASEKRIAEVHGVTPNIVSQYHNSVANFKKAAEEKLSYLSKIARVGTEEERARAAREFRDTQENINTFAQSYDSKALGRDKYVDHQDAVEVRDGYREVWNNPSYLGLSLSSPITEYYITEPRHVPAWNREEFLRPLAGKKLGAVPNLLTEIPKDKLDSIRKEAERAGIDPVEYIGLKLQDIRRKFETDIPAGTKPYQTVRRDEATFSTPLIDPATGKKVLDPETGLPKLVFKDRVIKDTPEGHVAASDEAFRRLIADTTTDDTYSNIQTNLSRDPNTAAEAIAKLDRAHRPIRETYAEYENPYLGEAMAQVAKQSKEHYERDLLPQLRSKFVQGNAFNTGAREAKEQHLAQDVARDLQDRLAGMRLQGSDMAMRLASAARDREVESGKVAGSLTAEQEHEKSRRAEQLAGMASRRDMSKLMRADMQHQMAERHRNFAQRSRDLEYDEFRRQQELPIARAAQYGALLFNQPVPTYTFSVPVNRPVTADNPQTLLGGTLTSLAGAMMRRPNEAPFSHGGRIKKAGGGELPYGLMRFSDSPEYNELRDKIDRLKNDEVNPWGDALMNLGAALMKNSHKGPIGALSEGGPSFVEGYRTASDENERRRAMALALKEKLHSSVFANNQDIAKILSQKEAHDLDHKYKLAHLGLEKARLGLEYKKAMAKTASPFDEFRNMGGSDSKPEFTDGTEGYGQEYSEKEPVESSENQPSPEKDRVPEEKFLGPAKAYGARKHTPWPSKAKEAEALEKVEGEEVQTHEPKFKYNQKWNDLVYSWHPKKNKERSEKEKQDIAESVATLNSIAATERNLNELEKLTDRVGTGLGQEKLSDTGLWGWAARKARGVKKEDADLINKMSAMQALNSMAEFLAKNKTMRGSQALLQSIRETKVALTNAPEANKKIIEEIRMQTKAFKAGLIEKLRREGFQEGYIAHKLHDADQYGKESVKSTKKTVTGDADYGSEPPRNNQKKKDYEDNTEIASVVRDDNDKGGGEPQIKKKEGPRHKFGEYDKDYDQFDDYGSEFNRNVIRPGKIAVNAVTPFFRPFDVKNMSDAEKIAENAISAATLPISGGLIKGGALALSKVPAVARMMDAIGKSSKVSDALKKAQALSQSNKVTRGATKFVKGAGKTLTDASLRNIASSGIGGATYEAVRQEYPDSVLIPMIASGFTGSLAHMVGGIPNSLRRMSAQSHKSKDFYNELGKRFLPSFMGKESKPEVLGRLAAVGAGKGLEANKKVTEGLRNKLFDYIKPKDKIDVSISRKDFEKISSNIDDKYLKDILINNEMDKIGKVLSKDPKKASLPEFSLWLPQGKHGPEVLTKIKTPHPPKELTFDDVLNLRSAVGPKAQFHKDVTEPQRVIMKKMYHSLNNTIGDALKKVGGKKAVKDWNQYNRVTHENIIHYDDILKGVTDKATTTKLKPTGLSPEKATPDIISDISGKDTTGRLVGEISKGLSKEGKSLLGKNIVANLASESDKELLKIAKFSPKKFFEEVWPNLNASQRNQLAHLLPKEARIAGKDKHIIKEILKIPHSSLDQMLMDSIPGKMLTTAKKVGGYYAKPEKLVRNVEKRMRKGRTPYPTFSDNLKRISVADFLSEIKRKKNPKRER